MTRFLWIVVPDHAELAKGTLKSVLRQANITRDAFLKLL
jgi:predicted RNA binding protein YcfA (HicA-like mRNA interferase family)